MKEILFSLSLFLTGGNIIDTKLRLHKYDKENYKEIFYLKNKKSISKKCIRHSKVETLKKVRRSREGGSQTDFQIHNPYPIQDTPQQDTFNSQRNN